MKLTDEQLVRGVDLYRKDNGHGPISLEDFGNFLRNTLGQSLTKSGLSVRLNALVDEEYLSAIRDPGGWGLRTFTMTVTEKGLALLESDHGKGMEGAGEASG